MQAQGERHFPEVDLLSPAGSGGRGGQEKGKGGEKGKGKEAVDCRYNHPGELYEILTLRPWLTN